MSKLGLLERVLRLVVREAEIPSPVMDELNRKRDSVLSEVTRLVKDGLIIVEDVSRIYPRLGIGESSAIHLAYEKGKVVVLDDKKARALARELGLEVVGTLSLLKALHEVGALGMSPEDLYVRLRLMGFYIDRRVFEKVFRS